MSFLKSGVEALLGRVLRRLDLEDASELTRAALRGLARDDLLDLGRPLELDEQAADEELADGIWQAVRGAPAAAREPEPTIPWGYGQDRVSGIAVDPNRLFVYWEVTDDAIAEARRGLGPGGDTAWLNLRVYDTSGRLFDGTNAHGTADHEVHREDRQWFLDIGKPGSEAFVEVGMKSREGYFVRIARSGRIEFPRFATALSDARHWMTVHVRPEGLETFPATPSHAPVPASAPAARKANGPPAGAPVTPAPEPARTVVEWAHTVARMETWARPLGSWSWESGPFRYPVDMPGPVTERFVGGRRVYRSGEHVHVVYGPWEVLIRGVDAHKEKTVLSRWETYRSWVTEEGVEQTTGVTGAAGSSERLFAGASGRRWVAGSEVRLGGASEAWYVGASELRMGGASEYAYLAASERMLRGASGRLLRGASERVLRGASGRLVRGASERRLGASEQLLRGASERRFPPPPPE